MVRQLSDEERSLLAWVLPETRKGYREVLEKVQSWRVIDQGRRGEGHWILAAPGAVPEHDAPLESVLAQGVVRYRKGERHVIVRMPSDRTLDVEFSGAHEGPEVVRWTLSSWSPSAPCPSCGGGVREVRAQTASGNGVVLALCATDRKVWVFDASREVSLPVPVTLFHSEVMRQTGERNPDIALAVDGFFTGLPSIDDHDLMRAFIRYNDIRAKVSTQDRIIPPERPKGWFRRLISGITGRQ